MTEAATAPHDHGPVQTRPTAVAVQGVSKTFGTGASAVTALDDVSFDVPQGAFVSVLGPSGCGKSTLMRLIAGLQSVSAGAIEVAGGTPDEMRRAREFGIVFQQPVLFDWRTVEQNVGLPLQIMGRPKGEARERVELRLPAGTDAQAVIPALAISRSIGRRTAPGGSLPTLSRRRLSH